MLRLWRFRRSKEGLKNNNSAALARGKEVGNKGGFEGALWTSFVHSLLRLVEAAFANRTRTELRSEVRSPEAGKQAIGQRSGRRSLLCGMKPLFSREKRKKERRKERKRKRKKDTPSRTPQVGSENTT